MLELHNPRRRSVELMAMIAGHRDGDLTVDNLAQAAVFSIGARLVLLAHSPGATDAVRTYTRHASCALFPDAR